MKPAVFREILTSCLSSRQSLLIYISIRQSAFDKANQQLFFAWCVFYDVPVGRLDVSMALNVHCLQVQYQHSWDMGHGTFSMFSSFVTTQYTSVVKCLS